MRAVLLWLLLQSAGIVQAQNRLTVGPGSDMINLAWKAQYLEDPGGKLSLEQVRQALKR